MLQHVGMSQYNTKHSSSNIIRRYGFSSVAFLSTEESNGCRSEKDIDAGGKPDYTIVCPIMGLTG